MTKTRATATTKKTATSMTYRSITATFGLALVLGLTACGGDDAATETEGTPQTSRTTPSDTSAATSEPGTTGTTSAPAGAPGSGPAGDVTATALQAIATAESSAGGTAYEIDDQDDDGTWEVDVRVGDQSVEVKVSADGQSVVETENDDLDDDDRAGLEAATITLPDAIQTAVDEAGGVLDDAELDEENGTHYWEVTVDGTGNGDDVEVKINVADGSVVSG